MNKKDKLKKHKLLIVVLIIYIFLAIISKENVIKSLNNSVYYLKEMAMVLPVIFVLTVVIEAWIPKETIIKGLGENSGVKGKVFSLALGSFSAGPIYAAFPIAKSLINKGASISNIVIILSAWAVIKVPMLVNEVKFLGIEFMAIRWVLTVIAILTMGFILSKFVKREDIPMEEEIEQLQVNKDYCIGCGLCVKMASDYYNMQKDKAIVIKQPSEKNKYKILKQTEAKCPSKAITLNI